MYLAGGASLALATAAAGINAGINLNDADDCVRNARRLREEAEGKRSLAQSLRSEKSSLSNQITTLESEKRQLEYSAGKFSWLTGKRTESLNINGFHFFICVFTYLFLM